MGSPLLGNSDSNGDGGKREYNANRCVCCWRVVVPKANPIPVCVECVNKLTPGERAAIVFAVQQTELLREMRGHLDAIARNDENDQQQLGGMAKAVENLGRMVGELIKRMDERDGRKRTDAERRLIGER